MHHQTATLPPFDSTPDSGLGAPRSHLFLVISGHQPLLEPARYRLSQLDFVFIGRGERRTTRTESGGKRQLLLSIPDPWISSTHARLVRALGRWMLEDQNSRNGTLLNGLPIRQAMLSDGDVIECGSTFFIFRTSIETAPEDPIDAMAPREGPLAESGLVTLLPPLAHSFDRLAQVAGSRVSVVIQGESGTGKELLARAVHMLSRRAGPFVGINCGALSQTLLESQLFGHRKGAFSGAVDDHPGLIRSADSGTLLLDEIGDLPLGAQAAFLRALQERQVLPVGGTRPVPVDFRLCAATHRDLTQLVEQKEFRADLLARISGFTMRMPALRERREDLGLIIGRLLGRIAGPGLSSVSFTKDAVRALLGYAWPLNIRELEKCLEGALALAGRGPIRLEHLPVNVRTGQISTPAPEPSGLFPLELLEKTLDTSPTDEDRDRCQQLVTLLTEHKGNISAVARILGKDRVQVRRWLRRYRLDPESFRDKEEGSE